MCDETSNTLRMRLSVGSLYSDLEGGLREAWPMIREAFYGRVVSGFGVGQGAATPM